MNKYDKSSRPWWIQHLDKGLLAGGMVYFLLVSGWMLFQSRQTSPTAIAETENVEIVTQADQEFIAYLQQSLETLKQPAVTPQAAAPVLPVPPEATVAIANAPAPPPLASAPPMMVAPPAEVPHVQFKIT